MGVHRARAAASPAAHAASADRGSRGAEVRRARHRACATGPRRRRRSRISSTGWCSACSPRTSGCCPTSCSRACSRRRARPRPSSRRSAARLFGAMQTGGRVGFERDRLVQRRPVRRRPALPLEHGRDRARCCDAADMDWSQIDPSIIGTLFERGLDPDKRSQLGAHYTDRDKIMMIVEPVIIGRWRRMGARRRRRSRRCSARRRRTRSRRAARTQAPATRPRSALSRPSSTGCALPRARPGLRLRQLPLSRAAGAEGPRASRQHRGRGAGPAARVPARRPGAAARASRSTPMPPSWRASRSGSARSSGCGATASRSQEPDPAAAGHDRMPGCVLNDGRHRG